MLESRIGRLWDASQQVLRECALPNGAMVAANSDNSAYPSSAENYRYVWARDNAFQIVAAATANMPEAADNRAAYMYWLFNKMDGFSETGKIVKRYATNGSHDVRYGQQYQPDQAGALLWAIDETRSHPDTREAIIMRQLANGLTASWQDGQFTSITQDLWENRQTSMENGDSFTYTLAACAHGLRRAVREWRHRTYEADEWSRTEMEMRALLHRETDAPHYLRKVYRDEESIFQRTNDVDNTLDASLDMLVYPFFEEGVDDPTWDKRRRTVEAIGRNLCRFPDGILRDKVDTYDGIVRKDGAEATAGRWPLLTFSHVISENRVGHTIAAHELYEATIDRLDHSYRKKELPQNYIPEQLFSDEREGQGILPLAWAHATFILATRELGLH